MNIPQESFRKYLPTVKFYCLEFLLRQTFDVKHTEFLSTGQTEI